MPQEGLIVDSTGVSGAPKKTSTVELWVKNNSGAARTKGDVVIWDDASGNADGFNTTITVTKAKASRAGVLAHDVASAGYGPLVTSGVHTQARVSGTTTNIAPGDLLTTGIDTGRLYKPTTATLGTIVAVAQSTATTETTIPVFVTII